jgi:hypothetical protein
VNLVVNRISNLFDSATATATSGASDVIKTVNREVCRGLELLEQDIRLRPKMWLGIAFALGIGLAWLIKRK